MPQLMIPTGLWLAESGIATVHSIIMPNTPRDLFASPSLRVFSLPPDYVLNKASSMPFWAVLVDETFVAARGMVYVYQHQSVCILA